MLARPLLAVLAVLVTVGCSASGVDQPSSSATGFDPEQLAYLQVRGVDPVKQRGEAVDTVNSGEASCAALTLQDSKHRIQDLAMGKSDADAVRHLCPEFTPELDVASTAWFDGDWAVPDEVEPGSYATLYDVTGCSWSRRGPDGSVLDEDQTSAVPVVKLTVEPGDAEVTSEGCGVWVRQ